MNPARLTWGLHVPRTDDDRVQAHRAAAAILPLFPRAPLCVVVSSDRAHLALSSQHPDERHRITLDWYAWPAEVGPAGMAFGDLHLGLPCSPFAVIAAEEVTVRLTEALLPWHGRVHTEASAQAVLEQRAGGTSARVPIAAPYGLPRLRRGTLHRHPLLPLDVAWINLWSADTADLLGFRREDEDLFSSSRTTRRGDRVLTLTRLPLDPGQLPAHARALRDVYARFPRIASAV